MHALCPAVVQQMRILSRVFAAFVRNSRYSFNGIGAILQDCHANVLYRPLSIFKSC